MNHSLREKTIAVFFTRGVSLQRWDKVGNLSREIALYNKLAPHMKRIYFFTYGSRVDLSYQDQLAENIVIVPKVFPLPNLLYMFALPFLARAACRDSDIFKTNQMKGGMAAMIAAHVYRKKLIVRCGYEWLQVSFRRGTAWWKRVIISWIERRVYRAADAIVLTAGHMHKFIHEQFGIALDDPRVHIIGNYIDTDLFKPVEGVKAEPKSICFVGRLAPQKNLQNLIRALSDSDIHLHLYGDGPLEAELRALAQENKVKATFHGRIANDELPEAMQRSEVFVLPSHYEGNPKTLLEAMACGMPVVGTDVEGINGVITNGVDGLLSTTGGDGLRLAMTTLLEDTCLRHELGVRARQTILQKFSLHIMVKSETGIYMNLVA